MELIKESDLVHRYVYRIRSRNLLVGVWDELKHGFTGIREKFDSKYLFTEYHWNYDPMIGTVRLMEIIQPETWWDGPLGERLGTVCEICHEPVTWLRFITKDRQGRVGVWNHDDPILNEHEVKPISVPNQALFDFLTPFDDAEAARNKEEMDV